MIAAYGERPLIGFTCSIEELKVDFELYESLYKASGNGSTMTQDQLQRYVDLKSIFAGGESK